MVEFLCRRAVGEGLAWPQAFSTVMMMLLRQCRENIHEWRLDEQHNSTSAAHKNVRNLRKL